MNDQQLKVDETILKLIESVGFFKKKYKACEKEIGRWKTENFKETSFTFYDVLTKGVKVLASYARNKSVAEALTAKKKYEDKFPIYGAAVTTRLKMGMDRKQFLNKTMQYGHAVFPRLPLNCIDRILDYLDNRDLKAVINCQLQLYQKVRNTNRFEIVKGSKVC